MTITQYLTSLPKAVLMLECMEMIQENKSNIENFIDRLIDRNPYLEEDDSSYSSLIPRMQVKFDDAMQEAKMMLEYERTLDWSDDNE
jgi:DNA-directed RNA polymerase specialized sigma54-like protein